MKLRQAIVPCYLAACIILGGASAGGYLGNLLLQLIALPLIVWALIVRPKSPPSRAMRQLQWLLVSLTLLFMLQLVPLPPVLWTLLPGRTWIADGFLLLGQPIPWLPISLSPDRTFADFVWLLPAIAVFLAMSRLEAFDERWIAWTVVASTMLSVMLGAAQIGGGDRSPLYFYRFTNWGHAVGFFANSNHLATLLVATLPFLAGLKPREVAARPRKTGAHVQGVVVILGCAALIVLVGLALNSSLAGAGLAVPAVAMSALLLRDSGARVPRWLIVGVGALTLGGVAAIMVGPFGNNLTGSDAQSQYSRKTTFSQSLDAGASYFPFGSGIGSFQNIYQTFEDPNKVTTTYINHVHSDAIEIYLETGVFGLAMIALFLMWWARESTMQWRMVEPSRLARAATIASATMLAHSLVDYPLRTAAISALFACCCALIAGARPLVDKESPVERAPRHVSVD